MLVSEKDTVATQGYHLNDGWLAAEEMNQSFRVEGEFEECAPIGKQFGEDSAQAFCGFVEVEPTIGV